VRLCGLDRVSLFGGVLVGFSLLLFRFSQVSVSTLTVVDWILLVPVALVSFAFGSKWLLEGVSFLKGGGLWPVVCLVYVFVWLIHASQFEVSVADSGVGTAFALFTLRCSSLFLTLSGVHLVILGEVVSMGPGSRIGEVAVTGSCSGLFSFLLFTVAFGVVGLDVGRVLGAVRLCVLFGLGAVGTLLMSGLRVFLVLIAGYLWGWGALGVAHACLGYILYPALISFFWYATLTWSTRLSKPSTQHDDQSLINRKVTLRRI